MPVFARYNVPMQIVNFPDDKYNRVGANGVCPHCGDKSYFQPMATHIDQSDAPTLRCISATKCQSCKRFLLVVGNRLTHGVASWGLEAIYPLGNPNDRVPAEVESEAVDVAADFKEALRCHWIKSYRASVVMCRRAIQSSAIALKANGGRLIDQIDDLFKAGKITEPLKDFAHEVRLTGNDGAHPDKDGLNEVKEKDSADIIDFTREFLHHVYVMPAKLKARRTPQTPMAPTKVP